jgi:C4-dicarboxylate transporter DctQ subunit
MALLTRLYDRFVDAMALIAAGMLIWLMVSVITSVLMRNLGHSALCLAVHIG